MSKKTSKAAYLTLLKKVLIDIAMTPKENKEQFLILKKKANKYLTKYENG